MIEIKSPDLFLVDFTSGEVKQATIDGWSLAEPQISDQGQILLTGHYEKPFRLGRIYCTNRPTSIFGSSVEYFPELKRITTEGQGRSTFEVNFSL